MADLIKFPDINTLAWKSTKAQNWDTKTKRTGSGRVRTMTTWQYPQYTITTEFAILSPEEHKRLMGFYASVKGGTIPFLWLDPEDYEEKGIRLGTGAENEWQAVRLYGDFREPVAHIEKLKLYANGSPVNAVSDKGVIRLAPGVRVAPTAIITADYIYYWKVMFSGDYTDEIVYKDIFKSKSFKLITVR